MFHRMDMFADSEKSLQLKEVSSSPKTGVWQQAAVTCDKGWAYPHIQEIQATKLQKTGSVIKTLILIEEWNVYTMQYFL